MDSDDVQVEFVAVRNCIDIQLIAVNQQYFIAASYINENVIIRCENVERMFMQHVFSSFKGNVASM